MPLRSCSYQLFNQLEKIGVISTKKTAGVVDILVDFNGLKIIADVLKEENYKKYEKEQKRMQSDTFKRQRIESYNSKYDYMTGEDFELFIAQLFERMGFENVTITKQTGDHGVDILAEIFWAKYAIQCKRYDSNIGNVPVQQIFAGKQIYNADVAILVTNQYFTEQAEEEAKILGVKLVNRDMLEKLLSTFENR